MVAVLPLLLYPLMGMAFLQVAQFLREHPNKVWVIGAAALPPQPPLLQGDRFASDLFPSLDNAELLQLDVSPSLPDNTADIAELAQRVLSSNQYDAVVYFPPQFAEQLEAYQTRRNSGPLQPPRPEVYYSSTKDRSHVAYERVATLLERWRTAIVQQTLLQRDVPAAAATPFQVVNQDVAETVSRRAAMWSKILPFVLIVWALTGAFYPAIDLCAGEKERGTLETLLCSPAERREIVWGKLLTVTLFSVATSLLNLLSLTATGAVIIGRLQAPRTWRRSSNSAHRRSVPWPGCSSPCCRWPPCSAPCRWLWPRWHAAVKKASTT